MQLTFSLLPETYGIYQLSENSPIPTPTTTGFWSFTRAQHEATVVCPTGGCPYAASRSEGWGAIKLHGPFDFALTGIVAEVGRVLAAENIGVFVMSTFDTDYIFIKQFSMAAAVKALLAAGHLLSIAGEKASDC
ncbi:MAG: ACT domain-containing protein [Alphaproteobacteria bacterium]|nr:ACT domain-containing protein [Alphaproteobacteria bacterium]